MSHDAIPVPYLLVPNDKPDPKLEFKYLYIVTLVLNLVEYAAIGSVVSGFLVVAGYSNSHNGDYFGLQIMMATVVPVMILIQHFGWNGVLNHGHKSTWFFFAIQGAQTIVLVAFLLVHGTNIGISILICLHIPMTVVSALYAGELTKLAYNLRVRPGFA